VRRFLAGLRIVLATALFLALSQSLAAEIRITIRQPTAEKPIFGTILLIAELEADEEVKRVDLLVDGRLRARLRPSPGGAPIQVQVDVGEENRSHRFEVVALGRSGAQAVDVVKTPVLVVDEVLDLRLQQVYVTVTNRSGHRVLGLEAEDFELRDAGTVQELVTVSSGDLPFTAVLLLDASLSMREEQRAAAETGVRAFAGGMKAYDEAKLMVFADRLLAASPFTESPEHLLTGLPQEAVTGGTALYDHLYWALRALEDRHGRQVVILLSDGGDVHSVLHSVEVRQVLRGSRAQLYWVELPSSQGGKGYQFHSFLPPATIEAAKLQLRKAVKKSGGRVLTVASMEEIPGALEEILRELREQYALGYYPEPKGLPGAWHKVRLKTHGRGLRVRARDGYFVRGEIPTPP